jgi:Spy/CpxP family protein refolding chaperone
MKDAHGHHEMKGHMQEWAATLKLTDDQKTQIHQLMMDGMKAHHDEAREGHEAHEAHEKMMGHGHEMLESFRGDTFAAPPPVDLKAHAAAMCDHILGFAEKVMPVLTAEQRKIAADMIRDRAARGEFGHFQ